MDFLDTNVLVYAVSSRQADEVKTRLARDLIKRGAFGISLQVLGEFYSVVTHPKKLAFDIGEAVQLCRGWRQFTVFEPTIKTFEHAVALSRRFQVSYYDAALLAAAEALGCQSVYSEDLSDRQHYGALQVINPFRDA